MCGSKSFMTGSRSHPGGRRRPRARSVPPPAARWRSQPPSAELRRDPALEPEDTPDGHLDEDRLQDHLVEARLREVAGREGVLAGDRLEHGLDRRPAGFHAQRDEAGRIGQEDERPEHRLALARVSVEVALLYQGLDLARGQSGGGEQEERGTGQPVEPPGRDGPGHAGGAEPRRVRPIRLGRRLAGLARGQRERGREAASIQRNARGGDGAGEPGSGTLADLRADDGEEALRCLQRRGQRGRRRRAHSNLAIGHGAERGCWPSIAQRGMGGSSRSTVLPYTGGAEAPASGAPDPAGGRRQGPGGAEGGRMTTTSLRTRSTPGRACSTSSATRR